MGQSNIQTKKFQTNSHITCNSRAEHIPNLFLVERKLQN